VASVVYEHASVRDPDRAIRGRVAALVVDLLIVSTITRGLGGIAGIRQWTVADGILFAFVQFAYFLLLESSTGQTIGKRAAGVRVAMLDGTALRWRAVAVRNALRILDAFPLLYASGLISVMRTGRARRQRMGDIAGGTTVMLQPGGAAKETPNWLLPVCTILAVGVSLLVFLHARAERPAVNQVPHPVAVGFPGENRVPPLPGPYQATGTTLLSVGYGAVEDPLQRGWMLTRDCSSGPCTYVFERQIAGDSPVSAKLVSEQDGWHATFAPRRFLCGNHAGRPVYWDQHSTFVLRFDDGGRTAQAHERSWSYSPVCGYGTNMLDWTATSAGTP
jgi:uncharacterized RDD family membrane protein YckC